MMRTPSAKDILALTLATLIGLEVSNGQMPYKDLQSWTPGSLQNSDIWHSPQRPAHGYWVPYYGLDGYVHWDLDLNEEEEGREEASGHRYPSKWRPKKYWFRRPRRPSYVRRSFGTVIVPY